ncbi:unnamed protein product [Scytosiphon promiscuus]
MRRLAGVSLGGGGSEFPGLLVGLVRASVHEMVGHKVSENRSAVAREACRCVAVLARCLTDHFGALAELWLPELLRNTTRAVVVAAAGDEAARAVFGCTKDGFPRLLPYLVDTSKNKSAAIRRRCLDYVMLALARWNDAAFDRHVGQIRDMVTAAIGDADSSVRATARRAYWVLRLRFPDLAEAVMNSLAPSMQRHVLREDQEFDAEAFVRAAEAAAEEPQPALGEHPQDLGGDDRGADNIATTPGPTDISASDRDPQASSSSTSTAAGSAARRVHGTHHPSQQPQRRPGAALFSAAAAAATESSGGGAIGGGAVRPAGRNAGVSALRVAGVTATANGGEGAVAAAAKPGAFRVPRVGGNATSSGANERSSVAAHAGGEAEPQQGFGVSGSVGGVSKVGRGAPSMRVPGRRGEEAGERGAEGVAMRAVVAEAVVLDRREVLRQVKRTHGPMTWSAKQRDVGPQRMYGTGSNESCKDHAVRRRAECHRCLRWRTLSLSRSASRRLEALIADRAKDTNFRVVAAALKLLGGLVEAQPALMAGHASALLPSVFPNLADTKEPVRQAANGVLDACRAAFPPHQLCSSLCPRVLELPPGRARTGLLEFLAVLVPHSSSYFIQEANPAGEGTGAGGHLHSLTQRVAAALVQTPPPANWDGGLGDDGRPTSAGPGASAAIRLLTALALSFCRSRSPSPSPSWSSGAVAAGGERGVAGGGGAAAAAAASGVRAEAVGEVEVRSRSAGNKENQGRITSFSPSPPRSPLRTPLPSPSATAISPPGGSAGGRLFPTTPGSAFSREEGGGLGSTLFAPLPQQQQQQPRRQALAPFTPSDLNRHPADGSGGGTGRSKAGSETCGKRRPAETVCSTETSVVAASAASTTPPKPRAATMEVVAGRLVAGLSCAARSHRKVEALSSLRGLADGDGVGAYPEFWPRYFGQVLTLLLDGAAAGENALRDGGEGPVPPAGAAPGEVPAGRALPRRAAREPLPGVRGDGGGEAGRDRGPGAVFPRPVRSGGVSRGPRRRPRPGPLPLGVDPSPRRPHHDRRRRWW